MTAKDTRLSIKRHIIIGGAVIGAIVPGVGGWMALTEIEGAVMAPGTVVVETSIKSVQHPVGGVVNQILARDGDIVRQGDVLMRLDASAANASLAITKRSLLEFQARQARLIAERDGGQTIAFPPHLANTDDGTMAANSETTLFEARQSARAGLKQQLRQGIEQMRMEITGLQAQLATNQHEASLLNRELSGARSLFDKQLIPVSRLTTLERDASRLDGERAHIQATVARTNGKISESELKILQLDLEMSSDAGRELREVEARIGELSERLILAEEQVRRLEIRAPQDGVIHQSVVHTVGGVVSPGETVMLVVPREDGLLVEARVQPSDVDEVVVGRSVRLRFSAFDMKTTPEASGTVETVAANVSTDQRTGMPYYTTRIRFQSSPTAANLKPGMPAEVFIKTGSRTVMTYLTQPLTDQVARAFRD